MGSGGLNRIAEAGERNQTSIAWICKCDCGKIKTIRGPDLRKGKSKSCGCLSGDARILKSDQPLLNKVDRRIYKKFVSDLKFHYKLSEDDFRSILDRQKGCCPICNKSLSFGNSRKRENFAIDHCHTTLTVRGILCSKCNLAIGSFGDDVSLLASAITYLNESKPNEHSVYGCRGRRTFTKHY